MVRHRSVWAKVAAAFAVAAIFMAIGCDGDSADSSDEASVPRVPLGVVKVPEGTPQGEWLEISGRAKRGVSETVSVDFGHTPLLWCYRGGS